MDDVALVSALNGILPRRSASLAVYLSDALPWIPSGDERFRAVLAALAADDREYANRLETLIAQLGGECVVGRFPMAYTDLNDLSAEFLLPRLISDARDDLEAVQRTADQLPAGSPARDLVEEIGGNLQGHLDILQSLGSAT